jgi:DNA-binding NarL/FixJ family response regulator
VPVANRLVRILVADDSVTVRSRLAAIVSELPGLELAGVARDARETIDLVARTRPDVVITDVRMPEGGGLTVVRELASHTPRPMVVVFTSYPSPGLNDVFRTAGADYFFDKPQQTEDLESLLEGLSRAAIAATGEG